MFLHLGVHHGAGASLHMLLRPANLQHTIAQSSWLVMMIPCSLLRNGTLSSEHTANLERRRLNLFDAVSFQADERHTCKRSQRPARCKLLAPNSYILPVILLRTCASMLSSISPCPAASTATSLKTSWRPASPASTSRTAPCRSWISAATASICRVHGRRHVERIRI